jgi:C4-dicarboxylate transporter, DctQ subunit
MNMISKAYNRLIIGLAILGGMMLALIFVGIVADVVIRTVGYNSIQWYSAIAEYCLLFSTMFGAPWLVRLKGHVVVESLTMVMPPMLRMIVAKMVYLLCITLSLLFVYYGWIEMTAAFAGNELDLRSIDMPKWLLFVPFPLGFSLVAIEFGRYLVGIDSYYAGKVGTGESL